MRNSMVKLCVCLTLAFGLSGAAKAQTRVEVGLRGSYLPLYSGDATVGSVHNWAATVDAALLLGPNGEAGVAAFYTISSRDSDPYNRAPRIQLAGLLLTLSRGNQASISGVGAFGLGFIDVTAEPISGCEPPLCFAEGGPSFRDARLPTVIGGLGFEARIGGPLRLRLDARAHLPLGEDEAHGDSGRLRLDIGAGFRFLVR
jgi:hypothetical protein